MADNSERIEPGIYRLPSGKLKVVVSYTDPATGEYRQKAQTVGTNLPAARQVRQDLASRLRGTRGQAVNDKLKVSELLLEHYFPWLEERTKRGRFEESTLASYRRNVNVHVLPKLGHFYVSALTKAKAESFLTELFQSGRRSRRNAHARSEVFYAEIERLHESGFNKSEIADLMKARFPSEATERFSRHAVSRILARRAESAAKPTPPPDPGLSESTCQNMRNMLRGAWRWALEEDMIAGKNIWALAENPQDKSKKRKRGDAAGETKLWNPDHYRAFFEWAIETDLRLWPTYMFSATSGDRRSGNLGVRWWDLDTDQRTADLGLFIKVIDHRIVVTDYGKTTGGHRIYLDQFALKAIERQRQRVTADKTRAGSIHVCPEPQPPCPLPGYHDRGLVFCTRLGEYLHPDRFVRQLQTDVDKYNRTHRVQLPRVDSHTLRHGWSSIAEAVGVSEGVRMDRLDQTSPLVNRGYTHAYEAARRDAAERVAETMFGDLFEPEGADEDVLRP